MVSGRVRGYCRCETSEKVVMNNFYYNLLSLLGFGVSLSCTVEYGCPPEDYYEHVGEEDDDNE